VTSKGPLSELAASAQGVSLFRERCGSDEQKSASSAMRTSDRAARSAVQGAVARAAARLGHAHISPQSSIAGHFARRPLGVFMCSCGRLSAHDCTFPYTRLSAFYCPSTTSSCVSSICLREMGRPIFRASIRAPHHDGRARLRKTYCGQRTIGRPECRST
jgi:hypothetical protein